MPIECAQGDRPARCPNHFFAVNEPSAVPCWWCFVLWSEVFWCLDVCCGVRSCDGHVIWCDVMAVLRHVTWCNAMSWWWAVLLQYYSLLQSTTPILLRTTKTTLYYSSTTLYYKVLLKYYSVLLQYYLVLQSTTPVLTCTTKFYSSTNLYYKVLLQYYPVLQSTTLYYKGLLQYYSVLQILLCTTPVLPCTTKYHSSTTLYYSSTTLYYKVLLQYYPVLQSTSWLIRITYETSFTMRGATGITLQLQQELRLPRRMNLMIDPHRIWNVIYNAQSNRHHPPTSPNTAPAAQNESHDWSTSHMKRHLQCAEQQSTPSNLTKYCACHAKWISWLIHIT